MCTGHCVARTAHCILMLYEFAVSGVCHTMATAQSTAAIMAVNAGTTQQTTTVTMLG